MNQKKFIEQLSKLVSFETLTQNIQENSSALNYVESIINSKALIKRLENNGRQILIASNKDTNSPDILYLVHMDVVSAEKKQFKLKVVGDKLMGRGVSDMKFSIPIGIALLDKIIRDNLNISFSVAITTDEETGGFDCAEFLANEYNLQPQCLIVPDGGDNLVFVNKSKGVCQLKVTVKGKSAHSSRPWEGNNAIHKLIKFSDLLLKSYEKNNLQQNWETTINIGKIEGGISTNQVCPLASMEVDFRYPETDSIENIFKNAESIAKQTDKKIKVEIGPNSLPTYTDTSNKIVKDFLKHMKTAIRQEIIISGTYGASDARHFAKLNIPILMIKPVGGDIHSEKEWISLSSCMDYYKGLEKFINNYD